MERAVLLLPDTKNMSQFLIEEDVKSAEVNSLEQTLVAPMDHCKIIRAETIYGTILRTTIPYN